jgi:hypothetical protein
MGVIVAVGVGGRGDGVNVSLATLAMTWVLVAVLTGITPPGVHPKRNSRIREKRIREVFKESQVVAYFSIGILRP